MPDSRTQSTAAKPIRAPRGAALFCQGWQQEAALRLLMNSLDPAVAENPEDLEVSAGVGKLARDWPAFDAIVNSLTKLSGDETLLIRSGVPAPILKTTPNAPRVLVVNSSVPSPAPLLAADEALQPRAARFAADWTFTGPSTALPEAFAVFRAAARKHFGGTLAGRLVVSGGMGGLGGAQGLAAILNEAAFLGIDADANRIKRRLKTGYCEVMVNSLDEALRILKNAVRKREPASVGLIANAAELIPELARRGILPDLLTDQTPASDLLAYIPQGLTIAQAADLRGRDPQGYRERSLDSVAAQARGLVELKKMGSLVFEFGNGIRAQALSCGVTGAAEIPDFVSEYLQPDLASGRGPLTIVALSGESDDIAKIDALFGYLFPDGDLQKWIAIARRRPSPGLPARTCWTGADETLRLSTAVNELVSDGKLKAPVVIGRSMYILRPSQIKISVPSSASGAHPIVDSPQLDSLLRAASGTAWLGVEQLNAVTNGGAQVIHFAVIADGKSTTADNITRVFTREFLPAFAGL